MFPTALHELYRALYRVIDRSVIGAKWHVCNDPCTGIAGSDASSVLFHLFQSDWQRRAVALKAMPRESPTKRTSTPASFSKRANAAS